MGWGGEEEEPSLPRRRENVLCSSFTESAEQRWVTATREVALPLMGLDLFFFASSSLSSKLSLVRAPFILTSQSTRGSRPSARGGTGTLDPSVRSPCSLLGARVPTWPDPRPRSARPAAASSPPWESTSEGCAGGSLLSEPV